VNPEEILKRVPPHAGRGRVLRVKQGYNPNSSSLGSIVFSMPAALIAVPALLAAAAAWIAARYVSADGKDGSADKDEGEGES